MLCARAGYAERAVPSPQFLFVLAMITIVASLISFRFRSRFEKLRTETLEDSAGLRIIYDF